MVSESTQTQATLDASGQDEPLRSDLDHTSAAQAHSEPPFPQPSIEPDSQDKDLQVLSNELILEMLAKAYEGSEPVIWSRHGLFP